MKGIIVEVELKRIWASPQRIILLKSSYRIKHLYVIEYSPNNWMIALSGTPQMILLLHKLAKYSKTKVKRLT